MTSHDISKSVIDHYHPLFHRISAAKTSTHEKKTKTKMVELFTKVLRQACIHAQMVGAGGEFSGLFQTHVAQHNEHFYDPNF